MRTVLALIGIGALLVSGWVIAQERGAVGGRPLDLPSAGFGDDTEDEDAPESITFYGSEYEGDGFFWCLDKSCSMGWGGELDTLKTEATQAVNQLSVRAEFGLNAFSSNSVAWSLSPRRADSASKSSAVAWISSLQAEGWTCLAPAGVQILQIANQSTKPRRQVLILGDGQPWCDGVDTGEQCLTDITAANYEDLPIHTLYISATPDGVPFFQQLAQENGGTFTLIQ